MIKSSTMKNVISQLKELYPELTLEILKEFLDTNYTELSLIPELDIIDLFQEWFIENATELGFGTSRLLLEDCSDDKGIYTY